MVESSSVITRPADQEKVLLNEEQAAIIEQDWALDYEIKQAQPREVDPVWAERTKVARAGGRIRATTDAAEAMAASALSMISVGTPSATMPAWRRR